MSQNPTQPDLRVRRASLAVMAVFVLNGFNFATWASRLPAIRDGLDFSPEKMGLLLLVGAVGSLVALPLSGAASSGWGRVARCSGSRSSTASA